MPIHEIYTPNTNIVYVNKGGSDSDPVLFDGSTPARAFLTVWTAMTKALTLSPTPTNKITISITDSGEYDANIVMESNINLEAPEATIAPSSWNALVGKAGTYANVWKIEVGSGQKWLVYDEFWDRFIFEWKEINATGTWVWISTTGAFASVLCYSVFAPDNWGIAIEELSSGASFMEYTFEEIFVSNTATAIKKDDPNGIMSINAKIINWSWTSTLLDINAGECNMDIIRLDQFGTGNAYDVASGAKLNGFASFLRWWKVEDTNSTVSVVVSNSVATYQECFKRYVQTTDSTPTTIYQRTIAEGESIWLSIRIKWDEVWWDDVYYANPSINAVRRVVGGSPVLIWGTNGSTISIENFPWTTVWVSYTISGNDLLVQVTGRMAKTINWKADICLMN